MKRLGILSLILLILLISGCAHVVSRELRDRAEKEITPIDVMKNPDAYKGRAVILLNDDWHTFDEVILQLVKAIKCSPQKASEIALEAHATGEAVCYSGPKERCEHVASILEEIELGVRIERAV
jgi:ATP-dependent Clp protease adaptor protein ClpS